MTNWDDIMTARARHGTFCGKSQMEETAYYAFFSGSIEDHQGAQDRIVAWVKSLRFALRRGRFVLPGAGLTEILGPRH